jgi:hypothetical protein
VLRVLSVMLLAAASVAHAGEHYREVWNPPEAKHALHSPHEAHHKPAAHRLSAKRSAKAKASRAVACASIPTKRAHAGRAVRINAEPRAQSLPPLLTPEGNGLRVDSHGARPAVAR